jgi:beta-galactosidase/beta-glucuronidase
VRGVAITHLVPHTFYQGEYPTAPLTDADKGAFEVEVRVHLWAPKAGKGTLMVASGWGTTHTVEELAWPAGESNTSVRLRAEPAEVRLWWPQGAGPQPLYHVNASLLSKGAAHAVVAATSRRIGFRHVALVTGNDTDPNYVQRAAAEQGTELHGMFFRVNGAVLFTRGANMIP